MPPSTQLLQGIAAMPLHVTVKLNDTLLHEIHIGRDTGGTDENDINTYLVVQGEEPIGTQNWLDRGLMFKHRYGDGANVCIMKAIQALELE